MNNKEIKHLSEDQLIWSVVDSGRLSEGFNNHLLSCAECQARKQSLEITLGRVGELAQKYSPQSVYRKMIFAPQPWRLRPWPWAIPALAVFMAVLMTWWIVPSLRDDRARIAAISQQMDEDAQLLADVDSLVNDPLPMGVMQEADESSNYFSDDFYRFLVPSPDKDHAPS